MVLRMDANKYPRQGCHLWYTVALLLLVDCSCLDVGDCFISLSIGRANRWHRNIRGACCNILAVSSWNLIDWIRVHHDLSICPAIPHQYIHLLLCECPGSLYFPTVHVCRRISIACASHIYEPGYSVGKHDLRMFQCTVDPSPLFVLYMGSKNPGERAVGSRLSTYWEL